MNSEADTLARLVAAALELGGDALDIEYEDGRQEVYAFKGSAGIGIASLKSSSEEACALRRELVKIGRRGKRISASGVNCRVTVNAYESFGETAFRVEICRTAKT